jgi:rhodanese-related sulfurtransferase/glyoxylase-like metal-dependent hydrolase (beta-lactamase superfamily II)
MPRIGTEGVSVDTKLIRVWTVATVALLATSPVRLLAQDAEQATHADEASVPQLSYERRAGEVTLRQYQLGCLSQLTYLIVSRGEALVVDPQRDVEHYVRDAKALGARIRYVALTHTNADFVAGHTELAARETAEILISSASASQFSHRGMRDGEAVTLGAATIKFIATPGHTLDSMSVLVRVPGADVEADPLWAMTGDALFIGSIGRPDLAQGSVSPMALAGKAFESVQRFGTLPDATIVLPAHGAGSLCGAHLSPDTTSTIASVKVNNPYFQIHSRAAFVARDVSGLPPAPQYFAYNVALNRAGPPVVDWTDEMPRALAPSEVRDAITAGAWVVDLRDARSYARSHVEGSINVSVRGRLDTWTGIVIPFEAPLVLVGSPAEVREAAFRFKRIGLDHVVGRLATDLESARAAGLSVRTTELVAPAVLADLIASGTEPILVDVRTAEEYAELAIGEYAHIELTDWKRFGDVLDPDMPVLFVCNSAYRSSMAVGLAERLGFKDVGSLEGGIDAWLDAGLPVYGTAPVCAGPVCPAAGAQADGVATLQPATPETFELPEPIEPAQLAALLRDQPSNYALLDLRPAWQYREYHLPGAMNVDPGALLAQVMSLPKSARVVLVDRDGTFAWAAGGAVSAALGSESRLLRVLAGGTARFWREIEIPGQSPPAMPGVKATPAAAPSSLIAPPAQPPAKKRSAGC